MEISVKLIQGKWLKIAMGENKLSAYRAAKELGHSPEKFYRHFKNQSHLNAESLAELAKKFPNINLHYVLTGEGTPLL